MTRPRVLFRLPIERRFATARAEVGAEVTVLVDPMRDNNPDRIVRLDGRLLSVARVTANAVDHVLIVRRTDAHGRTLEDVAASLAVVRAILPPLCRSAPVRMATRQRARCSLELEHDGPHHDDRDGFTWHGPATMIVEEAGR